MKRDKQRCIRCKVEHPYDIEHFPRWKQGYMSGVCTQCFPFVRAEDQVMSRYHNKMYGEIKDTFDAVYFAQRHDQYGRGLGLIKIGYSSDPEGREEGLKGQFKNRTIRIIGVIYGTVDAEKALHKRFEKVAVGYEWFYPSRALVFYIKRHSITLADYVNDRFVREMEIRERWGEWRKEEIAKIWADAQHIERAA